MSSVYRSDLEEGERGPLELLRAFWRLDEAGEASFPDLKEKELRWNALEHKTQALMKVLRESRESREFWKVWSYLYPLDHHELLHQRLHLPREVHCPLQHDEGMDGREGGLEGRLTLRAQHLRDTDPIRETFHYGVRCTAVLIH